MALNGGTFPVVFHFLTRGVRRAASSMRAMTTRTTEAKNAAIGARASFQNLAGAFTGIMAARAVGSAIQSFTKPARDMQVSLRAIAALTGSSEAALAKFEKRAMEVAGTVRFDPASLTNALLRLRQVTGSSKTAIESLLPTAQISQASAGRIGLMQAVELTGDITKGFGLQAGQVTDAMERIFALSVKTGVGLENFSAKMYRLGQAASVGSQSFDETMKTFAVMSKAMRNPAAATTMLTRTMQYLKDTTKQGLLEERGFKVLDEQTGRIRNTMEIFTELAAAYRKDQEATSQLVQKVWQKRAMRGVISILEQINQGIEGHRGEELNKYLNELIANSTGQVDRASKEVMKSLDAQLDLLGDAWQKVKVQIVKELLPAFTKLAKAIKGALETIVKFFDAHPTIKWFFTRGLALIGVAAAWLAFRAVLWGVARIAGVVLSNLFKIGPTGQRSGGLVARAYYALTGQLVAAKAASDALNVSLAGGAAAAGVGAAGTVGAAAAGRRFKSFKKGDVISKGAKTAGAAAAGTTAAAIGGTLLSWAFWGYIGYQILDAVFTPMVQSSARIRAQRHLAQKGKESELTSWDKYVNAQLTLVDSLWIGLGFSSDVAKQYAKASEEHARLTKDHLKKAGEVEAEKIRKKLALGEKNSKSIYKNLRLGGEALSNAVDKATGAGTFEPPELDMRTFQKLKARMGVVAEKGPKGERKLAQSAISAMIDAEHIIEKAARGEATPNELLTLQEALGDIGVGATHLNQLVPGLVGTGLTKKFREFIEEGKKLTSKENMEYSMRLFRMKGGAASTPEGTPMDRDAMVGSKGYRTINGLKVATRWVRAAQTSNAAYEKSVNTIPFERAPWEAPTMDERLQSYSRDFDNTRMSPAPASYMRSLEEAKRKDAAALQAKLTGDRISRELTTKTVKVEIVKDSRDPAGRSEGAFTGVE